MGLYESLKKIERETLQSALDVLESADFNPSERPSEMPYLKDNLASAILDNLRLRGIPTMSASTMYGTIPKEPMKRIFYGLRLLEEMPDKFMRALHDEPFSNWVEICFAAGAWARYSPLNTEPQERMPIGYIHFTMPQLVASYVRGGMDRLNSMYYREKKKGKYRAHQQIPFDSQIRAELNKSIESSRTNRDPSIEQILRGESGKRHRVKPVNLTLF